MGNEKKVLIVLVVIFLALAVFYHTQIYYTEKNKTAAVTTTEAAIEEKAAAEGQQYDKVKLFVINTESKTLVKKKESVPKSSGEKRIKLVFEKLKDLSNAGFNKNAEVLNVFIEGNDRVYINLSRDFIDDGAPSDIKTLSLYSVVNSVCALGYSKVKFMIENEDVEKLGGEIPAQDYFEKDSLLSKGE